MAVRVVCVTGCVVTDPFLVFKAVVVIVLALEGIVLWIRRKALRPEEATCQRGMLMFNRKCGTYAIFVGIVSTAWFRVLLVVRKATDGRDAHHDRQGREKGCPLHLWWMSAERRSGRLQGGYLKDRMRTRSEDSFFLGGLEDGPTSRRVEK